MCDYCEKEKLKYPNAEYDPICPKRSGTVIGRITKKILLGEELTDIEGKLFAAFDKVARPTFLGVPLKLVPIDGINGMITKRFGKIKE